MPDHAETVTCINCGESVERADTETGWTHTRNGVWCNPEYTPDNLHTQAEVQLIDGSPDV